MRCKACNKLIERELKDPLTGDYSDLCPRCFTLSEYVVDGTFTEPKYYVHADKWAVTTDMGSSFKEWSINKSEEG